MKIQVFMSRFERHDMAILSPGAIIGIAIGISLLAALVPSAISTFFNTSTEGWSSSAVSMWNIIPVILLAGIVLAFVSFRSRGNA